MRLPRVALPLAEQVLTSAFTFCLFFVAARYLDGEGLDLYAELFSLYQSFAFFLFGLVLLPVASSTGEEAPRELGMSVVLLGMLLAVFAVSSPFLMAMFDTSGLGMGPRIWGLALAFFVAQSLFETIRWLTIRLRGSGASLAVTAARFTLFFACFALAGGEMSGTTFVLLHVLSNLIAVVSMAFLVRRDLGQIELALPDRKAVRHAANLGNAVAFFVTNLVVVMLVDRGLGSVGLAAFQAIRSAMNPIGLLSQVIDNHLSAALARTNSSLRVSRTLIQAGTALAALLTLAVVAFAEPILRLLFGSAFQGYAVLVPILFTASLTHAATRPVFVNWRLAGDTRRMNGYSLFLILFGVPSLALLGWAGWPYLMITWASLLPLGAILIHLVRSRSPALEPLPR